MSPGNPLSLASMLPAGITPPDLLVFLSAVAAFITVFVVGNSYTKRQNFAPRLKALQERRAELKSALLSTSRRKRHTEDSMNLIRFVVTKLKLLRRQGMGNVSKKLVSAGFRSKDAMMIFIFFKLVMPIGFLVLSIFLHQLAAADPFSKITHWLIPVGAGIAGFFMPDVLLTNMRNKRWYEIQKSLADTLDLMLICAEAGLSLSAALDRVSKELGAAYSEMADELAMTSVELSFLPDRRKALENLAERVNIPEIRGIIGVLVQTEKYGTPISQALRVLSNEFRTQRMLRAEQKAARLPAIMTVPMIVFILPTLFIVVLAPAIVKLLLTTS